MKKFFLTLVALMSMTATFAAGENDNTVAEANKYNVSFNLSSLSKTLRLDFDQVRAVADINEMFASDMLNASAASHSERKEMVDKAVKRDLAYMRSVLDKEQYRKYVMLLNTTINNRGLNK